MSTASRRVARFGTRFKLMRVTPCVRVRVADAQRDGGEADEEPLTSLPVGVEAPGWMAAMVAAVTARVVKA